MRKLPYIIYGTIEKDTNSYITKEDVNGESANNVMNSVQIRRSVESKSFITRYRTTKLFER